MDPTANLEEQRRLATTLLEAQERGGTSSFDDVARLAELVLALDEWISKGGFLPEGWNKTT